MTVMDKLQLLLEDLNMSDFFHETKKELGEYGIVIIDPHKEKSNTFTSLVGIMGDDSYESDYTIDVIRNTSFIKIGTTEITIHSGRGVSTTFFTNPSALFSHITYPLLNDPSVEFTDGEIQCDLDLFLDLVRNIKKIRKDIDRSLRIRLKTYKKTFISKCSSWINLTDDEIKKLVNKTPDKKWGTTQIDAWRSSLRSFKGFMEDLK